jgi:hypothetical protein
VVTDALFDVVLCLSVEVSHKPIALHDLKQAEWRSALRRVASREMLVQQSEPERVPTDEEASALMNRALIDHPMGNVGARPVGGKIDRNAPPAVLAVVVAEILVQQDLAPIPDRAEYPGTVEGPLAEPRVVHARPWPYEPDSNEEQLAADDVLRALVADVPTALSIPGN